jgi:hypothetical protein
MVRIHLPPAKSRANSGTVTLVLDAAPAESRLAELLKPAAASPVAAAVAAPSGNATRVLVVRNTHHHRLSWVKAQLRLQMDVSRSLSYY